MTSSPLAADLQHVLEHTSDLWTELKGKRLFITGGTGFCGTWLLESFVWACDTLGLNAEALVLTRRPDAFRIKVPHIATHSCVRVLQGDVRTFEFHEAPCAFIIHAASDVATGRTSRADGATTDVIVGGTQRVLDFGRQSHVRKVLFVSSGAVYGRQTVSCVAEDEADAHRIGHASDYGEAKRLGELMCERSGLDVKIARGFAFVGPHLPLNGGFAIGNFIRDALKGGPVRVAGDGTPRRSYLYAADLVIWLWTILFRGAPARAYNVGSDHDVSIADAARIVASSAGTAVPVVIERAPGGAQAPERYVPDTRRAKQELGLCEWIDLRESVIRTVAWHRRLQDMEAI